MSASPGATATTASWLVGALLLALLGGLCFFQAQQHAVHTHISRGGMSETTKERFLKLGVDCVEVHEVQGHENANYLTRMYGLTAQDLHALNPGLPEDMELNGGQVVCIRGSWGVSSTGSQFLALYMWPLLAVGAALLGFVGSQALTAMRQHSAAPIVNSGNVVLTGSAAA